MLPTPTKVELGLYINSSFVLKKWFLIVNNPVARFTILESLGLKVFANGDLSVDPHHTVEDVGITIGQALNKALGKKAGINRFGSAYVPLDESLSRVVLDISGRPGLHFQCDWTRPRAGDFDLDLIREFFQGFVNHAGVTLHIENIYGVNAHHQCESIFKCFAIVLRHSVNINQINPSLAVPSTKGSL